MKRGGFTVLACLLTGWVHPNPTQACPILHNESQFWTVDQMFDQRLMNIKTVNYSFTNYIKLKWNVTNIYSAYLKAEYNKSLSIFLLSVFIKLVKLK